MEEGRRGGGGTALRAAALGSAGFLLLLLALPVAGGAVYSAGDLLTFHLPARHFYQRCIQEGDPSDWNPYLFCGHSFLGEGQAGTVHPFHRLLYGALSLPAAFDLEVYASYPAALLGMFLLLRARGLLLPASALGAILFSFGSFALFHFSHSPSVAILAHLPWILLLSDRVLREGRLARLAAAGVALLTASQLLLGHPQTVGLSLLGEAAFASIVWTEARPRFRCWAVLAAAKLAGLLLASVQVLPTLESLAHSIRWDPGADFATSFSLHPANFLQLLAPYAFRSRAVGWLTHEFALYPGALVLPLAWLAASGRGLPRGFVLLARGGLILAGAAALLAMGSYAGLGSILGSIPVLRSIRVPARAIVLMQFGLATAAAIGFHRLLASRGENPVGFGRVPWAVVAPLGGALLAIGGVLGARALGAVAREEVAGTGVLLLGPVLLGGAGVLVHLSLRGHGLALALLVPLAAVDLAAFGMGYGAWRTRPLPEILASVPAPPDEPGSRALQGPNTFLFKGWRQVGGYAGLPPRQILDYSQLASLRVAGVGWIRWDTAAPSLVEAGLRPGEGPWWQVPSPVARVRLVSRAQVSTDPRRDVSTIRVEEVALTEEEVGLPGSGGGQATLEVDRPGRIEVATEADGRRLLVVSESFHQGWRCRIDGAEARTLPVYGDFFGCVVEGGSHRVVFTFEPRSKRLGIWLSAAGGLGVLGLLGVGRSRRGRVLVSAPAAAAPSPSGPPAGAPRPGPASPPRRG